MQAGKYVWLTYRDVYDIVMKVGASIRSCGVNKVRFFAASLMILAVNMNQNSLDNKFMHFT